MRVWRRVSTLALLVAGLAGPVAAQYRTGTLYFQLTDLEGQALPGYLVTLLGGNMPPAEVTDDRGKAAFLALPPGNYLLRTERFGYSAPEEYPDITISAGRNTTVRLAILPGDLDSTWMYPAATPLFDRRNLAVKTTLEPTDLAVVPVLYEPRALLASTPGVAIHLEGIEVRGGILDFAAFEEAVVTRGNDVLTPAGGPVVDLTGRRGTDAWRGSVRYGTTAESGIDQGIEAGGPLLRDHLWSWGSYARPEIRRRSLDSAQLKVDGRLTSANALTVYAWDSDRTDGQGSGFGGRPAAWKVEDTQMFAGTAFLAGLYAQAGGSRTDDQLRIDGARFVRAGPFGHELRFGLARSTGPETTGLYVQDTVPAGPFTASLGLRWDRQDTTAGHSSATLSPRLGLTRLLSSRDLLKVSYARFAAGTGVPKTEEILAGADHQTGAGLEVGLQLTWRRAPELGQELRGARLTLAKLLSDCWMLRGQASWDDGPGSGPARWSYGLNGVYQVGPDRPWGFDVGFNLADPGNDPLGAGFAPHGSRDIHRLDLRLQKIFFLDDFWLTPGVDVFNALDTAGAVPEDGQEAVRPRSYRFGARFAFR